MSNLASQITSNLMFVQKAYTEENINTLKYWPFVRGIHQWPEILHIKGQ